MPAKVAGMQDLSKYLSDLTEGLQPKVAGAAVRAAANVIADEARAECRSSEVRDSIEVVGKSEKGIAVAKVQTAGDGAYIAPWLEFGTDPHIISVAEEDRKGRSVSSINRRVKDRTLVIAGHFVGPVIHHKGAKPYPFMLPALDHKLEDAIAAARDEIARRTTPAGLAEPAPPQDDVE